MNTNQKDVEKTPCPQLTAEYEFQSIERDLLEMYDVSDFQQAMNTSH